MTFVGGVQLGVGDGWVYVGMWLWVGRWVEVGVCVVVWCVCTWFCVGAVVCMGGREGTLGIQSWLMDELERQW